MTVGARDKDRLPKLHARNVKPFENRESATNFMCRFDGKASCRWHRFEFDTYMEDECPVCQQLSKLRRYRQGLTFTI